MVARIGKFVLGPRLARGGMAEIYRATALGPQGFAKPVVIKRLLPDLAQRPEVVAMFLDEARLAARLHHPHIVQIFELGREGDDHFICMELLVGEDLAAVIGRANAVGRPLPCDVVAKIVRCVAEGLQYAHGFKGPDGAPWEIVHGDVSPANVVVTFVGEVKLVDFGIARSAGALDTTPAGAVAGKLSYMAPEQLTGGGVDARADLWSLGVVMHELLTGRRLFRRDSDAATRRAVLEERIPDPRALRPDVPAPLAEVVMAALARDPSQRIASAEQLRLRIDAWVATAPYLPATAHLSAFMTELFGPEHVKNRAGTMAEGTGSHTHPVTDLSPARARGGAVPAVPLKVAEPRLGGRSSRAANGLVRVVGEVPAALLRAGTSMVAVPAQVATFALRWTRRRLITSAVMVTLVGFVAGLAAREASRSAAEVLVEQGFAEQEREVEPPVLVASAVAVPAPADTVQCAPGQAVTCGVPSAQAETARGADKPAKAPVPRGVLAVDGPKGGVVYLGNAVAGTAPLVRKVPAGSYTVAVVAPGGKVDKVWRAQVRPGKKTRLRAP